MNSRAFGLHGPSGKGSSLKFLETLRCPGSSLAYLYNHFFISPLREPTERLEKKDLSSQSGLVPLTIKSPRPACYKFASPSALNLTFFFSSVVPPPRTRGFFGA